MELISSNVVVAANQFNPTIFSQQWLVAQNVVTAEELEPPIILADEVSQVQTRQFQLLVVPQTLQFVPKAGVEQEGRIVREKIGIVVQALPHTPYTAIGLNFIWAADPEGETIHQLTRRLFFRPGQLPFTIFDRDDARFGGYFSMDFEGVRMKLDIKPGHLHRPGQQDVEKLMLIFNFHKPTQHDTAVQDILLTLDLWDRAKGESQRIVTETMAARAQ